MVGTYKMLRENQKDTKAYETFSNEKLSLIQKYRNGHYSLDGYQNEDIKALLDAIEEGVSKKVIDAMELKAYECYGGSTLYPCDYYIARDLLEKLITLSEDGQYYNTLGYIYYYGRCNDGIPDYDLAFKYFSVGAAAGIFESIYKLSDMLISGKGVFENHFAGARLIIDLYDENYAIFSDGHDDCKFADVAFRMGLLFEKGIGVEKDIDLAFYYLLQASYAIRKRIENYNYIGDANVKKKIDEAYNRVKKEHFKSGEPRTSVDFAVPLVIGELLRGSAGIDLTIKRQGLDFYLHAKRIAGEDNASSALIAIPELDYCNRISEATMKIKKISRLTADIPSTSFITDLFFDEEKKVWSFNYRDTPMLTFDCESFEYTK